MRRRAPFVTGRLTTFPPRRRHFQRGRGSHSPGADMRMRMAKNDFGSSHYDGPQPPRGSGIHHYYFGIFALDVPELGVPANGEVDDVLQAAQMHALAEADTV